MSRVTIKLELTIADVDGEPLNSVDVLANNFDVDCFDKQLAFARGSLGSLLKGLNTSPFEPTITEVVIE